MKNNIKKLATILQHRGYSPEQRLMVSVYLSIVFLGFKIPEVATHFKMPELKVQAALTFCGVELKKNKGFMHQMHFVTADYKALQELKILA